MTTPAFDGARDRGRRAFAAGAKLDANPYRATTRGRASYSTVFWRRWRLGWREEQAKSAKGDGQLNFRGPVMKFVTSNGRELIVYDIGDERLKLTTKPGGPPIKLNGDFVMDDDTARETVRGILVTGLYHRVKSPDEDQQRVEEIDAG